MRYSLGATQAPHASYRNGGSAVTARQYFLRQTARVPYGQRIAPAIAGLGPNEMRPVWLDSAGEIFSVRSPENNNGYNTLDWTPFAAWDEGTRQVISGGLRIMRKLKVYSDLTGDWREEAFPAAIGRLTGPGHWYSGTVSDGAGNVYVHLAGVHRYTPATGAWFALPSHVTTNGGSGSSLVWVPSLFSGAGGLIKYGGDARRWLIYNPVTNTWPSYTDRRPCGQHSILAYHPTHDPVLMVGGTGTETVAALVTPGTGAFTLVAAAPASIAMDTSDWMVPHPDGCWLLRSGAAVDRDGLIGDSLDDIESRQLLANESLSGREWVFSMMLPFADAEPVALRLVRGRRQPGQGKPPLVIHLHTRNRDLGEIWLQTRISEQTDVDMVMWAEREDVAQRAQAMATNLEQELDSAGLNMTRLQIIHGQGPQAPMTYAPPDTGSLVDVQT